MLKRSYRPKFLHYYREAVEHYRTMTFSSFSSPSLPEPRTSEVLGLCDHGHQPALQHQQFAYVFAPDEIVVALDSEVHQQPITVGVPPEDVPHPTKLISEVHNAPKLVRGEGILGVLA